MNRIYLFWVFSLFMYSCVLDSKNLNRSVEESNDLIGSWQFYEFTYSIGSSEMSRGLVENEHIFLTFLEDGSLESLGYFECGQARYRIEDDILYVDFECDPEEESRKYLVSWEGKNLVFDALAPTVCIEGCTHIFRKTKLE